MSKARRLKKIEQRKLVAELMPLIREAARVAAIKHLVEMCRRVSGVALSEVELKRRNRYVVIEGYNDHICGFKLAPGEYRATELAAELRRAQAGKRELVTLAPVQ